jgi:hypothetical protein
MRLKSVSVPAPEGRPYGGWVPCMEWCKQNCQGIWSYDTEGVFRFELDSDITAFLLKWS